MKTLFNSIFAAVNLYAEYFLGLLVSIIIARALPTEEYGLYASIIWTFGLITIGVNSGLSITVTKFVAEFSNHREEYLNSIIKYLNQLFLKRVGWVLLLFSAYYTILDPFDSLSILFVICLALASASKGFYVFGASVLKGKQEFKKLAVVGGVAAPLNLACVLAFSILYPTLHGFLSAYIMACMFYFFGVLIYSRSSRESGLAVVDVGDIARLNTQVFAATIIVFVNAVVFRQSQVIFLENANLLEQAAYFNIAFVLASAALTLVPGVYQEVLLPKMAKIENVQGRNDSIYRAQRYLFILGLAVVFPAVYYAGFIIEKMYGAKYAGAIVPLQLILLFRLVLLLNQGANLCLISNDRQATMAKFCSALLFVTVVLSILIVPVYGLQGAIAVYGISTVLIFIYYQYVSRRDGYRFISKGTLSRIVLSAIISSSMLFLSSYLFDGFIGVVLGSSLFLICFFFLLILLKGFDEAVIPLLNKVVTKLPGNLNKKASVLLLRLKP